MSTKIISKRTFIKLIYYYFKSSGVLPVSLKIAKTNDSTSDFLAFSAVKNVFYSVLLIWTVLILQLVNVYTLYNTFDIYSNQSEKIIDVTSVSLSALEAVGVLVLYSYRRKKIIVLIDKINESRKFLTRKKNNENFFYNSLSIDVLKTFTMNAFFWTLLVITSSRKFIISDIASYLTTSIIFSVILQYACVLKLLRQLFATANETLISINKDEVGNNIIENKHSQNTLKEISSVRQFYSALKKNSEDLSNFYSKPLLLCFFNIFRAIIVVGYYVFKPVVIGRNNLSFDMWIHCIIYGAITYFSLIVLTKSAEDVIFEVLQK